MIELSKQQVSILGRPNFACARIAQVLIEAGEYKEGPKKAEYEQAVFIHWATDLLETHGENWAKKGDEIIQKILKKLSDKPTSNV